MSNKKQNIEILSAPTAEFETQPCLTRINLQGFLIFTYRRESFTEGSVMSSLLD